MPRLINVNSDHATKSTLKRSFYTKKRTQLRRKKERDLFEISNQNENLPKH